MISDAIRIGAQGALAAENRFTASAQRMVSGTGDLTSEIVEQQQDKTAFKASLAVVRTGDQMMKSLLDIIV